MRLSLARLFAPALLGPVLAGPMLAGPMLADAGPAADPVREAPALADRVAAGELPPLAGRLPTPPFGQIVDAPGQVRSLQPRYGGRLRMLMAKPKDIRMMMVYGYARLVGHDRRYRLRPDLLLKVENHAEREFVLHLRPGHRWSDGHPFTSEDFRYYWEDVANNSELNPFGPPRELLVAGRPPRFEVLDRHRVRFSWDQPNPYFLSALAGARPLFIYRPAHYLRQFHARYAEPTELALAVERTGTRNWAGLHHRKDHPYKLDNPDRPSLQPWVNTTAPPAERYVFVRNPYYHRVDGEGRQLPYIDEVVLGITDNNLIPAKTGAGDADLQARYLRFDNYTFLKQAEKRNNFEVRLWRTAGGSRIALYPNLNSNDAQWREVLRDRRFRRALSLAIDRHEINQVVYYGLVSEGANTVLPQSPLFRPEYRQRWAVHDPERANRLLDEMGLVERDGRGIRRLGDGRPMELIVETAGESTEEADVLELIHDAWLKIGVKLYTRPSQREVFRNRVFAGDTLMSVWAGLSNGVATAEMSPTELAPTEQVQLQWPKWGQYYESGGKAGEPPDMPAARELLELNRSWARATEASEKRRIWQRMLEIHADEVFSIGTVAGVMQPVVVSNGLQGLPESGIYNWEPGAYFGVYRLDLLWFDERATAPAPDPPTLPANDNELAPDAPYEPLLDQEVEAALEPAAGVRG